MKTNTAFISNRQIRISSAFWVEAIAFLYILLFVYAAMSKLLDYQKFTVQIGQSPLLTDMAGFIAWFIPAAEIVIAMLLSVKRFRLLGLYASFTLMVMFTVYIIAILNFSDNIPCSCGGVLEKLGWTEHLVFNIGFVLLAILGIILHAKIATLKKEEDKDTLRAQ